MSAIHTIRSIAAHRGESVLDLHRHIGEQDRELKRLRRRADQATQLEARNDEQAQTIHSLRRQLEQALAIKDKTNAKAGRCDDAERQARTADREMKRMQAALRVWEAHYANQNRVSVPAPRDLTGGVLPLWDAVQPVTDPGDTGLPTA